MPADTRNDIPRDLVPEFARLVREARTNRGWGQRDLATHAGVSLMCVWGIEAERRSPSLRIAAKIAKCLGLKVDLADFAIEPKPRRSRAAT